VRKSGGPGVSGLDEELKDLINCFVRVGEVGVVLEPAIIACLLADIKGINTTGKRDAFFFLPFWKSKAGTENVAKIIYAKAIIFIYCSNLS